MHPSPRAPLTFRILVACISLLAASCDGCEEKKPAENGKSGGGGSTTSTGGEPTASWLVGQAGLMVRLSHDAEVSGGYHVPGDPDLLNIACRGQSHAWVVGTVGTALWTQDSGATWTVAPTGVTSPLRAISVTSADVAYAVGDHGVLLASADAGHSWRRIDTHDDQADFTSVVSRGTGTTALVTTNDGRLLRYEAATGALSLVAQAPTALHAVTMTRGGDFAAAVGDGGALLFSSDSGATFELKAIASSAALRDVWIIKDGTRIVAVGDDGTYVDGLVTEPLSAHALTEPGVSLRGLHLEQSGHGMIVGTHGTALMTHDGGVIWTTVKLGDNRDVYGVDALEAGPHL